jgi:hypothetical protein
MKTITTRCNSEGRDDSLASSLLCSRRHLGFVVTGEKIGGRTVFLCDLFFGHALHVTGRLKTAGHEGSRKVALRARLPSSRIDGRRKRGLLFWLTRRKETSPINGGFDGGFDGELQSHGIDFRCQQRSFAEGELIRGRIT